MKSILPLVNACRYRSSSVRVDEERYGVTVRSRESPSLMKYGIFNPVPSCDVVRTDGARNPEARLSVGSGRRNRGR